MSTKSDIKKRIADLPTWQLVLGSAAVLATGGGLAYYAIAQWWLGGRGGQHDVAGRASSEGVGEQVRGAGADQGTFPFGQVARVRATARAPR